MTHEKKGKKDRVHRKKKRGRAQAWPATINGLRTNYSSLALMRTCLSWIQPDPHRAILRHLLNTENSFLCSSTNYFENRLLPNDLIIVRNDGDDEEDKWDIKRALERQGDTHIKVEIQSN
jgi:hypothetical protein